MKIIENYLNNILKLGSFKRPYRLIEVQSLSLSQVKIVKMRLVIWEFNTYVIILIIHAKLKLFFGAQMSAPSN